VKLEKEKLEQTPKESWDVKALQKDLEQLAKLLEQKRITLEYTQADVGLIWGGFSLGRCLAKRPSVILRLCSSVSVMCKLRPLLPKWV